MSDDQPTGVTTEPVQAEELVVEGKGAENEVPLRRNGRRAERP